ncbi:MAG: signal peptidase I [Patescibacteria group bacterium]|nr:signal peptidase I [Patescibacteria group bacterium]
MFILRKIYSFFVDTFQTILIVASFFLVMYIWFFRPFQVNGSSMFPNFEDKEYVITNLIAMRFEDPKRGDVIVFKAPVDHEKEFIKRVIGLPGDTISLKNGEVYINDQLFDQSSFLKSNVKTYGQSFLKDGEKVTVPNDNFFVMGDNRPYSSDSREWGFVKKGEITGRSMFIYWPVEKIQMITNPLGN